MTRKRWLLLGVLAMVAVTAIVFSRRGPAGITVDTVSATRQSRFLSTVTASGEIIATRYADIGSSVMGKIVSLPVVEGEPVRAGQILARIDAVQAESDVSSAQAQVLALAATLQGAREQVQAAMADVVAAEARAADAWDRRTIRTGSLLRACAWCKRVDVGGEWTEIDVALEPLRIFELERLPAVTHGICDACHQTTTIITSYESAGPRERQDAAARRLQSDRTGCAAAHHVESICTGSVGSLDDAVGGIRHAPAGRPVCLLVVFAAGSVSAQTSMPGRIVITVEGLNVWQQRNDVRIPPDTGTEYRPAPRWTVFGGYRTIEGGADVDAVYTFAWLNAVVTGIGARF